MVKAIITTMYMKTWRKERKNWFFLKKSVYCIVFDDMMLRCEMWSVLHANEWQRIDKAGNWCRHWTVSVTICINSLPNGCIWSPKSNTMSESALALSLSWQWFSDMISFKRSLILIGLVTIRISDLSTFIVIITIRKSVSWQTQC